MRRLLLCMALAVASARPLDAQTILYATAASQQRIDGFHVRDDGSPSPERVAQQPTAGIRPRRIIARGCNLYVAERDRVEVFRIRRGGRLDLIGATLSSQDTRSHDIELYPDPEQGKPTTLMVPLRRQGAIAAYPLDDEGRPSYDTEPQGNVVAGRPLSCVYGPFGADWEDIEVENDKLYAAFTDRIEIYGIVKDRRCTNDLATVCTVNADCRRCETGHGDDQLRCSNNIAKLCTTSADCVGTCETGLGDGLRCSNDVEKTCLADSDCAPICATGQLVSAAFKDEDGNGVIDPDETSCGDFSTTPLAGTLACLDSSVKVTPKKFQPKRPSQSCPFSFRGRLAGAVGLVVDDTTLVFGARFTHRMQGFTLLSDPDDSPTALVTATGNFPPVTTTNDDKTSKKERKQERRCRKRNRTGEAIRYIGLTLRDRPAPTDPFIVYGAGYVGRTDAFRLKSHVPKDSKLNCDKFVPPGSPTLPNKPTSTTAKDVTSTPTRTALGVTAQGRPVLYVAAGELDRVQAFRLFEEGGIDADQSPMETNVISGSFPNDVVLVDITSCD